MPSLVLESIPFGPDKGTLLCNTSMGKPWAVVLVAFRRQVSMTCRILPFVPLKLYSQTVLYGKVYTKILLRGQDPVWHVKKLKSTNTSRLHFKCLICQVAISTIFILTSSDLYPHLKVKLICSRLSIIILDGQRQFL